MKYPMTDLYLSLFITSHGDFRPEVNGVGFVAGPNAADLKENPSHKLPEDGLELTHRMKKGGQVPFGLSSNNSKEGHHHDRPGKTRKT